MLIKIKDTINKMYCHFFGHKLLNKSIIAYSIDAGYMYATISIYIKSRNVEDAERLFAKKSIHMISLAGILSILQMKKRKFFEKEESYQSLKHIKK